jgi:hypothetical protein
MVAVQNLKGEISECEIVIFLQDIRSGELR